MKRMPPPLLAALVFALLLALLAGCAGRREPVPDNIGYHQLQESFGDRDLTPLEGRRILLDPGHGGFFRGVVGLDGLDEADVNLGVALWLRGLLEAAGAEVHMTRTADTDFLCPADSSLSFDLAARSALCDTLAPDVFVSLHHNSNAQLDRDMNETQTYYPVGREGADLDLARSIHKHLVRNLEISPAKIMAGNFSVLRNATVPAVLGEPSMLSNPGVEKKLSGARKQRLEAEAYFLGLLDYFRDGTPEWVLLTNTTRWVGKTLTFRFIPDSGRSTEAPSLDPSSIVVLRNGKECTYEVSLDGEIIHVDMPPFMRPADNHISIQSRNTSGRSSRRFDFDLDHAWTGSPFTDHSMQMDDYGSVLLSWKVREGFEGEVFWWRHGHRGRLLSSSTGQAEWNAGCTLEDTLNFPPQVELGYTGSTHDRLTILIPGWYERPKFDLPIRWALMNWPSGDQTITDGKWTLRAHPGTAEWSEAEKRRWLPRHRPAIPLVENHPAWLEIRGARPILIDATHRTPWQAPCDLPQDTLVWQPLVPELVGKTIVIDPHGGAADADGTAPMGTPGRELNLRTAKRLAALLRGAGAEAVLSRDDPGFVPPEAKVLQANEVDADLFITLRRAAPGVSGTPDWSVAHHYGSRGGAAWGRLLAQTLARFATPDTVPVTESYAYLLRHTACPAVEVSLPLPTDLDAEETSRSPAYQLAVASALMSATAAWFQGEDLLLSLTDPRTFIIEHAVAPTLLDGCDWIRVDGNWLWLPPRDDTTLPALLPLPGDDHTFEVRRGDRWELLISNVTEGPGPSVWPFWTSEKQPTNPFATTETIDDATGH
jgi:N-acetylmuramoyl-L-alanine amidase